MKAIEVKELTTAQKSALWFIWKYDGVRAADGLVHVDAKPPGEKWHKIDARTIVALVGRGLLSGSDGIIRCSEGGLDIARRL